MLMSTTGKKRRMPTSSPPRVLLQSDVRFGLLDCYNFISPNEYSDKTFGLFAFFLRKSVGEINFSHLIDECQRSQTIDLLALLKNKRTDLPENEASIQKCLMLNRLITYIENDQVSFNKLISDIRLDMKHKMKDNQIHPNIQYPEAFRQREKDYAQRKSAQDIRRLFYVNHSELKEPPSIIHLQNRTTEQLSYLVDYRMKCEAKFQGFDLKEVEKILFTSFMITSHPQCGVNPVLVYERKGSQYTARVSVTIVSLLHDFMQLHPNLIELGDIELTLSPSSKYYKLHEPQSISWKTCQLQACSDDQPRTVQYAELSLITIQQSNEANILIHFNEVLHSLKFSIKLRLNLPYYNIIKTYSIPLETLPFSIVSHNSHIPHMLTRVMLNDIQRFQQCPPTDYKSVMTFIVRYFMHRTGVEPDEFLRNYLEQELIKAKNERANFQTMEDIYMDFLVPFVHQVEFMAKYPILAMFYADGLSLGICNSTKAAELMMKSPDKNSSIVNLRLNSIKIDYKSLKSTTPSSRTMKVPPCAVRVDIYNDRTKVFQYRTFDSTILTTDIYKFVVTASTKNAGQIRVLSNLANNYKSYTDFSKYDHPRLREIYKTDGKYKPLTHLIDNIDENNGENHRNNENQSPNSNSNPPNSNCEQHNANANTVIEHMSISYDQSNSNQMPLQNILSPPNHQPPQQMNSEDVVQYVLARPELMTELLQQFGYCQLPVQQQQQFYPPQLQMPYQNQPTSFQYTSPQIQSQYQQSLINQPLQQRVSYPMMSNPMNSANQYQTWPGNGIPRSTQQNLQMPENILPQTPPVQDFEQFLNDLLAS